MSLTDLLSQVGATTTLPLTTSLKSSLRLIKQQTLWMNGRFSDGRSRNFGTDSWNIFGRMVKKIFDRTDGRKHFGRTDGRTNRKISDGHVGKFSDGNISGRTDAQSWKKKQKTKRSGSRAAFFWGGFFRIAWPSTTMIASSSTMTIASSSTMTIASSSTTTIASSSATTLASSSTTTLSQVLAEPGIGNRH